MLNKKTFKKKQEQLHWRLNAYVTKPPTVGLWICGVLNKVMFHHRNPAWLNALGPFFFQII